MENRLVTFRSYKKVMAHFLTGPENRGQLTKAAAELRCQRSYLSRVISEKLQLTRDHAFGMSHFLKFNDVEREYFLLLVDHERASEPEYRKYLSSRIAEIKRKSESLEVRMTRNATVLETGPVDYFSSWLWSAVHFLTAVPQYQTSNEIGERLGLSTKLVNFYLEGLVRKGFVERHGSRWIYKGGEFHAKRGSALVLLHHQNWRQRAFMDAQDVNTEGVHFTAVQTMSRSDFALLKQKTLDLVAEFGKIAGPSAPEEAVAFTCDFFHV